MIPKLKLIDIAFRGIKNITNALQLFGFIGLVVFIMLIFIPLNYGDKYKIILYYFLISLILVAIMFSLEKLFRFMENKEWHKSTASYQSNPEHSPALIAAKRIERNEGKKAAYQNCLKEIEEVKNLSELKKRVTAILNSVD